MIKKNARLYIFGILSLIVALFIISKGSILALSSFTSQIEIGRIQTPIELKRGLPLTSGFLSLMSIAIGIAIFFYSVGFLRLKANSLIKLRKLALFSVFWFPISMTYTFGHMLMGLRGPTKEQASSFFEYFVYFSSFLFSLPLVIYFIIFLVLIKPSMIINK